MTNQKKHNEGMSPVAAAVTGAVVGASVAVAGAVALKDEKNREKVKEAFTSVKDQAVDHIKDAQKHVEDRK